jgi:DNA mismatch repair ATPase MutS
MKAYLLYKDRDFHLDKSLPPNEQELTQDLELETLWSAMAQGDKLVFDVAKKVVLSSVSDLDTIHYRQHILQDCLNHPSLVRQIYALAQEAIEGERKVFFGFLRYPDVILHRSIEVLQMLVGVLKKLRAIADEHAALFSSEGFTTLWRMVRKELDDDYFASIAEHLKILKFRNGVLMSAQLGRGNKGINYILRKPPDAGQNWIEQLFAEKPPSYTITIPDRDENGARALSELKDRGLNLVANALAQSTDHILSFFTLLRTELAFYIGCLNLYGHLGHLGEPVSFPQPVALGERQHVFRGLYDVCLSLTMGRRVVGNTVNADGKDLVIITGANQGGKSTFLRSIGLAQVMMQCGMFVPAESFRANVCSGLFTHYKRQEDVTMKSGKLAEELGRMSDIVGQITPDALLLCNESFASTNEREGSEIARQITSAFIEKRIKVFFVTHFYDFAQSFYRKRMENTLFLRAERKSDGTRTFKVIEGEPLQTSYGEDVYDKIFGHALE